MSGHGSTRWLICCNACRLLQGQLTAIQANGAAEREKAIRLEEAKRRREDEARLEKRSPIADYCDMLAAQGEGQFKDSLVAMGAGNDVPRLFRHNGRVWWSCVLTNWCWIFSRVNSALQTCCCCLAPLHGPNKFLTPN